MTLPLARPGSATGHWVPSSTPLRALLPYLVALLALVVLHPSMGRVSDVSWYVTLAERVLDGQRLYIDIVDPNPPASVWLYLPAVFVARVLGLAPEAVVDLQVLLLAALSVWFFVSLLAKAGLLNTSRVHWLAAGTFAILAVLPGYCFAQRENFIAILLLPFASTMIARADAKRVAGWQAVLAGLAGGIAISVKPHFAMAIIFMSVAAWVKVRRFWLLASLEIWISGLVLAGYGLAVAFVTPEFFSRMLPVILLAYLPVRLSLLDLLMKPAMALLVVGGIWLAVAAKGARHRAQVILAAASLGCAVAYAVQGKGWPYQSYPMLAFVLVTVLMSVTSQQFLHGRTTWDRMIHSAICLGMAAATHFWLSNSLPLGHLRAAMADMPAHPRMLQISEDIGIGFPLVRQLGGTWVGRASAQWITDGRAERRQMHALTPADSAQLDSYAAWDRQILLEDIRAQKPDVILVHVDSPDWIPTVNWTEWAAKDPEISAELAAYEDRGAYDGVRILKRRAGQ